MDTKPFLMMRRAELVELLRDSFGVNADALRGKTVQALRKIHSEFEKEGVQPSPKRVTTPAREGAGVKSTYARRVLNRVRQGRLPL